MDGRLSVFFLFLLPCLMTVSCLPKPPGSIPKDFYKRQILQPIPGYIPVYIKADGVPQVRTKVEPMPILTKTANLEPKVHRQEEGVSPRLENGENTEQKVDKNDENKKKLETPTEAKRFDPRGQNVDKM